MTKEHIVGVFDRAARSYDQVDVDFFQPIARELVAMARIKPIDDVLDVGCGRGAALFEAAKSARTVVGTDLAPTMVELTRQQAPANAEVLLGDAEEPDFPDNSFDVITANLVIFFLPDPAKALRNYARLLRPNGRLVFNSFGREPEPTTRAVAALAKYTQRGRPKRNAVFDSAESIKNLLSDNGFRGQVTEKEFESRLRGPEHWLEWAWTHGIRGLLEQIDEADFPSAKRDAFAELGEGELVLTSRIRFAYAQCD